MPSVLSLLSALKNESTPPLQSSQRTLNLSTRLSMNHSVTNLSPLISKPRNHLQVDRMQTCSYLSGQVQVYWKWDNWWTSKTDTGWRYQRRQFWLFMVMISTCPCWKGRIPAMSVAHVRLHSYEADPIHNAENIRPALSRLSKNTPRGVPDSRSFGPACWLGEYWLPDMARGCIRIIMISADEGTMLPHKLRGSTLKGHMSANNSLHRAGGLPRHCVARRWIW